MNPSEVEPALARFWEDKGADGKAIEFTESLVKGVLANQKSIDADIRSYAENWELGRMAVVDRNVLRMAIYEMKFCPDIPPVVSINEAVDIVKYYSSTESGRFVNGILDRIRKDVDRPARKAVRKTSS
jgi:N utilization substance protein B